MPGTAAGGGGVESGGSAGTVGLYLLQATATSHPSLGAYVLDSEQGVRRLELGAELRAGKRGARCHECARPLLLIWHIQSLLEST